MPAIVYILLAIYLVLIWNVIYRDMTSKILEEAVD